MIDSQSLDGLRMIVAAVDSGEGRYMWTPHHATLVSELLTENDVLRAQVEQLVNALSPCADYFNARDEMNAAVHTPSEVRFSPITLVVNDAMTAWRNWNFG